MGQRHPRLPFICLAVALSLSLTGCPEDEKNVYATTGDNTEGSTVSSGTGSGGGGVPVADLAEEACTPQTCTPLELDSALPDWVLGLFAEPDGTGVQVQALVDATLLDGQSLDDMDVMLFVTADGADSGNVVECGFDRGPQQPWDAACQQYLYDYSDLADPVVLDTDASLKDLPEQDAVLIYTRIPAGAFEGGEPGNIWSQQEDLNSVWLTLGFGKNNGQGWANIVLSTVVEFPAP